MTMPAHRLAIVLGCVVASLVAAASSCAQALPDVTAQVQVTVPKTDQQAHPSGGENANVVIWLTPADGRPLPQVDPIAKIPPSIVQQNKSFLPHVLVVRVGTSVLFPNHDRFLHNVFSLHDGRQFDLGFYEAGSAKSVRFARPGISYLFCNIHPEMTAVVIAVESPFYGVSDSSGKITIPGVPGGKYLLHVWSERSLPEELRKSEREVVIYPGGTNLGAIRISADPNFTSQHKNKYGQDYVPAAGSDYSHPE